MAKSNYNHYGFTSTQLRCLSQLLYLDGISVGIVDLMKASDPTIKAILQVFHTLRSRIIITPSLLEDQYRSLSGYNGLDIYRDFNIEGCSHVREIAIGLNNFCALYKSLHWDDFALHYEFILLQPFKSHNQLLARLILLTRLSLSNKVLPDMEKLFFACCLSEFAVKYEEQFQTYCRNKQEVFSIYQGG